MLNNVFEASNVNRCRFFFLALAFIVLSYRAANIAKITPITTITDAPTVPPTVAGKLSDENWDNFTLFVVSEEKETVLRHYINNSYC